MSERDAIAAIRAALNRVIEDYDRDGIDAGTTRQVAEALTASNIMKLLRAYDELSAPAVAEPVVWQQTSADSKPLWRYDSFASTPEHFDYSRPLYATPVHAPAPADDVHHGLDNDRQVLFYEQDFYVLSNFSSFTLYWDGLRFDTSEAAYHYEKFPGHPAIRAAVKNAPSAHEAFKIAEGRKPERRADWDAVKVGIMRDILRAKADQHYYVRRKLLDTGDRKLIENSWRDDFWGWGPNRDGKNMLGNLWMDIRAELRREAARRALKGKT